MDAGPLGLASYGPNDARSRGFYDRLHDLERAGADLAVPAIADYEVRRELLRRGATHQIEALDVLRSTFHYVEVTGAALDRAAGFWALLRQAGRPTADPHALDADAILAGIAAAMATADDRVTIATGNLRHLSRFPGIEARLWDEIGVEGG